MRERMEKMLDEATADHKKNTDICDKLRKKKAQVTEDLDAAKAVASKSANELAAMQQAVDRLPEEAA